MEAHMTDVIALACREPQTETPNTMALAAEPSSACAAGMAAEQTRPLTGEQQVELGRWSALFREFEGSGLSEMEFCRQRQIARSTWWRKRQAWLRGSAVASRRGRPSTVPDDLFAVYATLWQSDNKPSMRRCWTAVLGAATEKQAGGQPPALPSPYAFHRRLVRDEPEAARYFARNGYNRCRSRYGYHIYRDNSQLLAGSAWCSDHAQSDVAVICPDGKIRFPWYTAWIDIKSYKWLGWTVHVEDPNSDHIAISFRAAAAVYGIPLDVVLDNGKDYLARDIAGGRRSIRVNHDEIHHRSLMGSLDIVAHFAKPYNARSKQIERRFREVNESFSRMCPGYRGPNTMAKPESYELARRRGDLLTLDEFITRFDRHITEVYNKEICDGKTHQHRSPDHVWDSEYETACAQMRVRFVEPRALALFCRRVVTARIHGNGIYYAKLHCWYWAEWMVPHLGKKVDLRLARDNPAEPGWVFFAGTWDFLGQAEGVLPIAALATTAEELAALARESARQSRHYRLIKEGLIKPVEVGDVQEHQVRAAALLDAAAGHVAPAMPVERKAILLTGMDAAVRQQDTRKAQEAFDPFSVLPADITPRRARSNPVDDYIMQLGEDAAVASA